MLEITIDKFRALEGALDNYIQTNIISLPPIHCQRYFVSLVMKPKWRREYKKNKYSAIIQIIMSRYGSIKLIGRKEVVITRKRSEIYKLVHKHTNYKRTKISKYNLMM